MLNYPSQKIVTVCDKCLTETCTKGQFSCADRINGDAGSITDTEEKHPIRTGISWPFPVTQTNN